MARDPEKRAELTEHLAELRARLIRSIVYVIAGTIVAWFFYDRIFSLLVSPMASVLEKVDSRFLLTTFPEAFVIRMEISIVAGLILALPLLTFEAWGFVSPGLTPEERGPIKWIAPLSAVLFLAGVSLCYYVLPVAFGWFASYVPEDAELRPTVQSSILFTVKMLLAFGIVFELPVFLVLLAKVGIVDSRMLRDNWRYAVVLASIVAAVATPSNDAFTMLVMAVPVVGLYFFSILLVAAVERTRPKQV